MKPSKKLSFLIGTLLIGLLLVMGGCTSAAKKPISPTPNTPTTPKTTTPAPKYQNEVAKRSVVEANKVAGVNKATAVVSGKTIYLGLDLKANLNKNQSKSTEKDVESRVKRMERGYTVMVTSDIDTVTRIKKVANGLAQGKPLSSFKNELETIGTRLTPKTR